MTLSYGTFVLWVVTLCFMVRNAASYGMLRCFMVRNIASYGLWRCVLWCVTLHLMGCYAVILEECLRTFPRNILRSFPRFTPRRMNLEFGTTTLVDVNACVPSVTLPAVICKAPWLWKGNEITSISGDGVGTVVKVLCYKSEGCWFDSRWCHWNFSLI